MKNNHAAKLHVDQKAYYRNKIKARLLARNLDYTTSKLAWQASVLVAILVVLLSYSFKTKSFNMTMLSFGGVYLLLGIFSFYIVKRIRADVYAEQGEVRRSTRWFAYPMIPMIFIGNIFVSIAGFMLAKKKKSLEYMLLVYSLMTLSSVLAISLLNLMKQERSQHFMKGVAFLIAMILLNLVILVLSERYIKNNKVDRKLLPLAILAILQIGFGNAFSFLFGLIILSKLRRSEQETAVEWIEIIGRLFRNYMAVIGMFIVVLLMTISIVSPLTFDYDLAVANNYQAILKMPSGEYPFGTDNYGRCVFTRIIFGAKISLVVGMIATLVPIVFGGLLGAIAAYYGKALDNGIMRFLDILYAVPGILMAIAIIAAFGANTVNLILALSVGNIPIYARTVRATVLSVSKLEFIEAAKASGGRSLYIIARHIIPNSLAPVIVRATIGIGGAVLSTSALSYLGLGVEPHVPEWGNILKAGSGYLETNPYIAIFPGLAIILIVLAFNFFGDGLRDALDPKLK